MNGKWKVTSNYINDQKLYAVYRLINVEEVDHSGNREMATDYMENRQEAESIAENLNEETSIVRA